ncbi:MAG: hypothetical protein J6I49_02475 [Bacteroidales bacterium]|nr:hypothetical protein [Bacteroidales bacterium]
MQLGLDPCHICPRDCGVSRRTTTGYCGAPQELEAAAICIHRGEEPPFSGLVNVFFPHCNLHCIYCQNRAISGRQVDGNYIHYRGLEAIADRIAELLPNSNGILGLVTASHYAPLLPSLLSAVQSRGVRPTVLYNSSGYERVDALQSLEGLVDIYLPDLKYLDADAAGTYSHAPDYPLVATAALKEMQRQVGASLKVDAEGVAFRGMAVRHLVLPGLVENSLQVIDWLADNLPHQVPVSLMSQYYPPTKDLPMPLNRRLKREEYEQVCRRCTERGLVQGWRQDLESEGCYRPDFSVKDNPFEPII